MSKKTSITKEEIDKPENNTPAFSEEDKINFAKSFIADRPFVDSYTLLGGAVTVTFKSLTSADNIDIYTELKKLQNIGELSTDAGYITQLTCSRLALSIDSLNGEPFCPNVSALEFPVKYGSDLDKEYASHVTQKVSIVKKWSIHKLSALTEVFKKFEDKLIALLKEVETENFWPADK